MNRIAVILIAGFAEGLFIRASAALPDSAEMKLRDKWVARHFDGKAATVPFSFTYGGRSSGELLPAWRLERAKAKAGGEPRTLAWTDPASGLRIRAEIRAYADLPAVEWVLRFENSGSQNTPLLERILPLDVALEATAQDKAVIHHSLGEKNTVLTSTPARSSSSGVRGARTRLSGCRCTRLMPSGVTT